MHLGIVRTIASPARYFFDLFRACSWRPLHDACVAGLGRGSTEQKTRRRSVVVRDYLPPGLERAGVSSGSANETLPSLPMENLSYAPPPDPSSGRNAVTWPYRGFGTATGSGTPQVTWDRLPFAGCPFSDPAVLGLRQHFRSTWLVACLRCRLSRRLGRPHVNGSGRVEVDDALVGRSPCYSKLFWTQSDPEASSASQVRPVVQSPYGTSRRVRPNRMTPGCQDSRHA